MELTIFIFSVIIFLTACYFAWQKMKESKRAQLRVEEEEKKFSSF